MITIEKTSPKKVLKELATKTRSTLFTKHGRQWQFAAGALAPHATVHIDEQQDHLVIHFLYVEQEGRRSGMGRKALERVIKTCDAQPGGVELRLAVCPVPLNMRDFGNIPYERDLVRFYGSMGFEVTGHDHEDGAPLMTRTARTAFQH